VLEVRVVLSTQLIYVESGLGLKLKFGRNWKKRRGIDLKTNDTN
jgi:hypothetical protein